MRWMLYAGIGTVFVLGGVAGGLVGVSAERDRVRKLERATPNLVGDLLGRRLGKELSLDENQVRRVREIYAGSRPQIMKLERERRRDLRNIMDDAHQQITEILTPRQKERFLQIQRQLKQRLRLRDPDFVDPAPNRQRKVIPPGGGTAPASPKQDALPSAPPGSTESPKLEPAGS